jgi:hypothetical protein
MDAPASPVNEKTPASAACRVAPYIPRLPHRGLAAAGHFAPGPEQGEGVMTDATDSRHIIARVPFVDGLTRDVYEDADGRQWVVAYDGERVYGVWLPPADEPVIVSTQRWPAGPGHAGQPAPSPCGAR